MEDTHFFAVNSHALQRLKSAFGMAVKFQSNPKLESFTHSFHMGIKTIWGIEKNRSDLVLGIFTKKLRSTRNLLTYLYL